MSNHENAPATQLLATHCAVCNRPLVDAKSVELGIGPVCRRKYQFNLDVTEAARAEANRLVYQVAVLQRPCREVTTACARIRELGFTVLADKILARLAEKPLGVVTVEPYSAGRLGDGFLVRTGEFPGSEVVDAFRSVPGRRWFSDVSANFFPASSRRLLWGAIRATMAGWVLKSAQGEVVVA